MKNVRVIVCPVDSKPYIAEIADELESYQEQVEGYIETVPFIAGSRNLILCDEEGKISGKPVNKYMTAIMRQNNSSDYLVGTCVVLSANDEGEFCSVADEDTTMFIIKKFHSAYDGLARMIDRYEQY